MLSAFPTFFIATLTDSCFPCFMEGKTEAQRGVICLRSHTEAGRIQAEGSQPAAHWGLPPPMEEGPPRPEETPTCSVAFQDATELHQELLKVWVIWPQLLATLDGREEGSTQQCVGHQGAEEAEAREKLLQGLQQALPGRGWPCSLHPPTSAQNRRSWWERQEQPRLEEEGQERNGSAQRMARLQH